MLRNNQKVAIQSSIDNDFASGVHFHATGTGKSYIILNILMEFNKKYPTSNVIWLCEQKSILMEQLDNKILKQRGFKSIIDQFFVHNFTKNKPRDWVDILNSTKYWSNLLKKPILLVINRAFLTEHNGYEKWKTKFDLILHDECHSITNKTTKQFYQYINIPRCIGFSATPVFVEPFDKIISKYTIYDSFTDNIIVPPKIYWLKSQSIHSQQKTLQIIHDLIQDLPYKKIIVWCGLIKECHELAKIFSDKFPTFKTYVDTSEEMVSDIHEFRELQSNGFLFCAAKHKEGSDIPFLDGCIFMDGVEKRSYKAFVQCIGRVLRLDPNGLKKEGFILDLCAKSSIEICNRVNQFLFENTVGIFPWKYETNYLKDVEKTTIHSLRLIKTEKIIPKPINLYDYSKDDIIKCFIRKVPSEERYYDRLTHELDLFINKNLTGYLFQAIRILELTNHVPHVTRGSCGSSLVCYLLGISNVDPVKYDISFSRFLNIHRTSLPDIDFDFSHVQRDEVFLKIALEWPTQVARISNHVYFGEKSAIRESIRKEGYRKFIAKSDIMSFINGLDKDQQERIKQNSESLVDTFKTYSLHCGGIVFYPDGVPEDKLHIQEKKSAIPQVKSNKLEISNLKQFKIDILSSRAISQLCDGLSAFTTNDIRFDQYDQDPHVIELFASGQNIGLTLAESPLIRKAFLKYKPKCISDIAMCLSIIRPAAKNAQESKTVEETMDKMIYDDDAIHMIVKMCNCSEDDADKYRRAFANGIKETQREFIALCKKNGSDDLQDNLEVLKLLRKYSFCKSHAISYAQLIWQLAVLKVYYPKKFWVATLKYCESSYRKWVHVYEAKIAGVSFVEGKKKSVFSKRRSKTTTKSSLLEQLRETGLWDMTDGQFIKNCYYTKENNDVRFRGIIAYSRQVSRINTVIFICTGPKVYVELVCKHAANDPIYTNKKVICEGFGKVIDDECFVVEVDTISIE